MPVASAQPSSAPEAEAPPAVARSESGSSSSGSGLSRPATIAIAAGVPGGVIILVALLLLLRSRRRKARFFKRGITPIDDDEIESWKVDKADEKDEKMSMAGTDNGSEPHNCNETDERRGRQSHRPSGSFSSQKPPSIIIYARSSEDLPPHKRSIECPPTPVLARAPNSRPGLTDETVQGADAFVPQPKRNPSRLAKPPPAYNTRHQRSKSARSARTARASLGGSAGREQWYGRASEYHQRSPRPSADSLPRPPVSFDGNAQRSYVVNRPRVSFDEEMLLGGLSPRPLIHKSEIGRAIG